MKTWNHDERKCTALLHDQTQDSDADWRLQWTEVCGSTVGEGKAWRAHPEPASLFWVLASHWKWQAMDLITRQMPSGANISQTGKYVGCVSEEFHSILSIRGPTEHLFCLAPKFFRQTILTTRSTKGTKQQRIWKVNGEKNPEKLWPHTPGASEKMAQIYSVGKTQKCPVTWYT